MTAVRLFGRVYPRHVEGGRKVKRLRLRVLVDGLPAGARVDVADVQLQSGDHATGWTPHSADQGVAAVDGWQFRNGIAHGADNMLVVMADVAAASPARWDIRDAAGTVQVGGYRFGRVVGSASVDGLTAAATQGAGIPPHMTARADVDVPVDVEGRANLTCWFRGHATSDSGIDPPDLEPIPDD